MLSSENQKSSKPPSSSTLQSRQPQSGRNSIVPINRFSKPSDDSLFPSRISTTSTTRSFSRTSSKPRLTSREGFTKSYPSTATPRISLTPITRKPQSAAPPSICTIDPETTGVITDRMIARRNVPEFKKMDTMEVYAMFRVATHVRLDHEGIESIGNLECLPNLTHLYLQHNKISLISHMEKFCKTLKFLILNNNNLKSVSGLKTCEALKLLDLSHNNIISFDEEEYPASIEYLVMHENPCSNAPDFRLRVAFYLPEIEEINELRVTKLERRLSKATFGNIEDMMVQEDGTETESSDEESGKGDSNSVKEDAKQLDQTPRIYLDAVSKVVERSKQRQLQDDNETNDRVEQFRNAFAKWTTDRVTKVKEFKASNIQA